MNIGAIGPLCLAASVASLVIVAGATGSWAQTPPAGAATPTAKFVVPAEENLFLDAQNQPGAEGRKIYAPPGADLIAVVLGAGNPLPNPNKKGPCIAVIYQSKPYIVDAGADVWRQMAAAAISHRGRIGRALSQKNVSTVILTHLHADHIVGLPSLYLQNFDLTPARTDKFTLYGPSRSKDMMDGLVKAFSFQTVMRANELDGTENVNGWRTEVFEYPAEGGTILDTDSLRVDVIRVLHGHVPNAYSIKFITPERTIVISGDISGRSLVDEKVQAFYKDADVVFLEISSEDTIRNVPYFNLGSGSPAEVEKVKKRMSFSHATSSEAARFANLVKPKVLALYHLQNFSDPYDPEAIAKEIRKYGYDGMIVTSRDLDVF
jgi:ribonuclease Z